MLPVFSCANVKIRLRLTQEKLNSTPYNLQFRAYSIPHSVRLRGAGHRRTA
jgi:hypothetical protein